MWPRYVPLPVQPLCWHLQATSLGGCRGADQFAEGWATGGPSLQLRPLQQISGSLYLLSHSSCHNVLLQEFWRAHRFERHVDAKQQRENPNNLLTESPHVCSVAGVLLRTVSAFVPLLADILPCQRKDPGVLIAGLLLWPGAAAVCSHKSNQPGSSYNCCCTGNASGLLTALTLHCLGFLSIKKFVMDDCAFYLCGRPKKLRSQKLQV